MMFDRVLAFVVASIAALVFFLFGFLVYDLSTGHACKSQWEGHNPSYTVMGGCKIVVDGVTIPASAYRVDGAI